MAEKYKTKPDLSPPYQRIFIERPISYSLKHGNGANLPVRKDSLSINSLKRFATISLNRQEGQN